MSGWEGSNGAHSGQVSFSRNTSKEKEEDPDADNRLTTDFL